LGWESFPSDYRGCEPKCGLEDVGAHFGAFDIEDLEQVAHKIGPRTGEDKRQYHHGRFGETAVQGPRRHETVFARVLMTLEERWGRKLRYQRERMGRGEDVWRLFPDWTR
jgi:hypothetical protein